MGMMMKRAAVLLVLAVASNAIAQTTPDPLKIDDVKTPTSPAFVLLGVAPTDVDQPTTPRALGLALISSSQDSGGNGIPRNLAIEVAPYWLQDRPSLTFDQYNHPGFWQGLQQSFSISVATKNATSSSTGTAPSIGALGARAMWPIGKSGPLEQQILDAYQKKAVALLLQNPAPTSAQASQTLRPYVMSLRDAMREGRWIIETAAAASAEFPQNNFNQSKAQKNAFWLTPSYRFNRSTFDPNTGSLSNVPSVDFIGVLRYTRDRTVTNDNPFDAGARLLWENDTIAISGETIERFGHGSRTNRTAINAEYKVNDDFYVTATFGKNYDNAGTNGNLITLFGINFNAGRKPTILPPAPAATGTTSQ